MKKKRFSEEQITYALAQESTGETIAEICCRLAVSQQTFYRWKKKFGAMGLTETLRLKQLEKENAKLKRLVADMSLDKTILQDVLRNGLSCLGLRPAQRRELVGHLQTHTRFRNVELARPCAVVERVFDLNQYAIHKTH